MQKILGKIPLKNMTELKNSKKIEAKTEDSKQKSYVKKAGFSAIIDH